MINDELQKEFIEFVIGEFDKLGKLFYEKNRQYATTEPLANFRAGSLLHYGFANYASMFEEAKSYARKHIAQVYGSKQDITTPKVDESLRDIAVYSAIMLFMHKKYMEDGFGGGND